jgi:type II secretory pathway component PulF
MPTFVYTARSRTGEKTEGTVEAPDRRAALLHVERLGYVPVTVDERSAAAAASAKNADGKRFALRFRNEKMSTREILIFTTELSDLLASGMTLGNALNCLSNQETGKAGDRIIKALRDEIIQGASLSEALANHPATFSRLYVSMIQAGEASGAMADILRRLVVHYERVQEAKEKVIMALTYPMFILVIGIGALIFLMVKVVPQFKQIFDEVETALPLPTQILINSSNWIARYGLVVAAGVVIAVVIARRTVKTERGRVWWHGMLLKMPLIRGIVASGIYGNFARTLATLLSNGVPVLQALGIVEQTVGNAVISKEIRKARDRVTDGTTISSPLAASKVFPRMMTDMMEVGEQTGDMSSALTHIARRYESELDRNVKILTTALEPIMIVLVAATVGFVAVAILMAVSNLTSGLGM